jgi:hypothetical protein
MVRYHPRQRRFVATAVIVAPTALAKNRAPFCDLSDVDDAVLQIWFGMNGRTHTLQNPCACTAKPCPVRGRKRSSPSKHAERVLHHEALIRALEAFDAESGFRWHESVEFCIIHQQKFEIYRLQNDCAALRKPPFRSQYLALPLRRRVRMQLTRWGILKERKK